MTAQARTMILTLLASRAAGATVCPSEVARVIAAADGRTDWREDMTTVHAAVTQMVADGDVRLSWRGAARAVADGPYRIGRGEE